MRKRTRAKDAAKAEGDVVEIRCRFVAGMLTLHDSSLSGVGGPSTETASSSITSFSKYMPLPALIMHLVSEHVACPETWPAASRCPSCVAWPVRPTAPGSWPLLQLSRISASQAKSRHHLQHATLCFIFCQIGKQKRT